MSLDLSFNAITIDGDTSTNDSFIIMATGQSANRGEIALRIQRACRELGIKTVVVYSTASI